MRGAAASHARATGGADARSGRGHGVVTGCKSDADRLGAQRRRAFRKGFIGDASHPPLLVHERCPDGAFALLGARARARVEAELRRKGPSCPEDLLVDAPLREVAEHARAEPVVIENGMRGGHGARPRIGAERPAGGELGEAVVHVGTVFVRLPGPLRCEEDAQAKMIALELPGLADPEP